MFKPHQGALVAAALAAIAIMTLPLLRFVALPIQYFNTHTHELCHALTAIATGGQVQHIEVDASGGGITPIVGGNLTFTASAGYVGASLIGAMMILFGRTPEKAKRVLFGLGAILLLSMLIWVRGDLIGIISGLFWGCALLLAGLKLNGNYALFAVQFLGVEQCLTSLNDLLILMHVSAMSQLHSDAKIMESVWHVPALFWALGWSALSIALMLGALRADWHTKA